MQYIIHSIIIFNTSEYILTLVDNNNKSIKLSNSAGRVLEELIKYHGTREPITREYLFSTVWKKYGLFPSNGNLNQQVSLIRKNFISLGLNVPSIITIPKRGLKLNDQLIIMTLKENINYKPPLTKKYRIRFNKISNTARTALLKQNIKYIITITITTIIVIAFSIIYLHNKEKNNQKLYFCKQINSCNICALHPIPGLECKEYNLQINETIKKNFKRS